MDRLYTALKEIKEDLDELGASWAVVGGLAISARAEPRTTRDIDIAVAVASDKGAERLVRDLTSRGYRIIEPGLIEQEVLDRIATVRLDSPSDGSPVGVVVDLMFASSGIEPEIVDQAETIEFLPGLDLPIVRTGHLIALKVLAGRPQDLADLDNLMNFVQPEDLVLAEAAARSIEERGTHRRKALVTELRRAVERHSSR